MKLFAILIASTLILTACGQRASLGTHEDALYNKNTF